jgi:tetratricopeptide (TPR) repeat protein
MSQENLNPYLEEVTALLDLGLKSDALALIEAWLETSDCLDVQVAALEVFTRVGIFDRAAAAGDALLKEGNLPQDQLFRIALAFNYADRIQDAYNIEKSIAPHSNDASLVRLYGIACKAAQLGRYSEALGCMMSTFRYTNIEAWDAHRKIFIDSELASLWEKLPNIPLPLREAMRYCNLPFDEIIADNENTFPLRCLDHRDMAALPARFRKLLQPVHSTCFEINPRRQAAHPRLYKDYVRWQEELVRPRLDAFRALRDRIRQMVIDQQLAFAEFQAANGRIASARNHLVCHLEHSSGASLESLPNIPVLQSLISEFKAMNDESPETFRYLISWKCKQIPEEFIQDVHSEMPPVNRASGYAELALGCMHFRLGNNEAAIQHWSNCAKIWPSDDAPIMNATMLLSGESRWEEATKMIERLPETCMQSSLWKKARNAIREQRPFSISNKNYPTPVIPTPSFGGLYSGADEDFLVEQKKYTPVYF